MILTSLKLTRPTHQKNAGYGRLARQESLKIAMKFNIETRTTMKSAKQDPDGTQNMDMFKTERDLPCFMGQGVLFSRCVYEATLPLDVGLGVLGCDMSGTLGYLVSCIEMGGRALKKAPEH